MNIDWKKVWSFYATVGIPLLYLYNIYLAFAFPKTLSMNVILSMVGFAAALEGCSLWIISYIHLSGSFGVLPQKQKRVTRGIYRYFSHPMYAGIYLTFLGLSFANESLPGLVCVVLIITPLLFLRASFEDKQLY